MRKFVAGNWKMNGLKADIAVLTALQAELKAKPTKAEVAICVPFTLLNKAVETGLPIGAQDCHTKTSGAFTGDISANMIADIGAEYVIIGHSERRDAYKESNSLIAEKSKAVVAAGLHAIICVGESLAQREAGTAIETVSTQLAASIGADVKPENLTIAYEPIWAIGTGKIPTLEDVKAMHAALRGVLVQRFGDAGNAICLQYGGSVKPDNASELAALPNVDGFLVGGASLKADTFLPIARAFG